MNFFLSNFLCFSAGVVFGMVVTRAITADRMGEIIDSEVEKRVEQEKNDFIDSIYDYYRGKKSDDLLDEDMKEEVVHNEPSMISYDEFCILKSNGYDFESLLYFYPEALLANADGERLTILDAEAKIGKHIYTNLSDILDTKEDGDETIYVKNNETKTIYEIEQWLQLYPNGVTAIEE